MTNDEGYVSAKDWTESEESDKTDKKPHWCSLIRNTDTEYEKKFDYQMRQDDTQR